MRAKQLGKSSSSHTIRSVSIAVKYAFVIYIFMLLDNLGEFLNNGDVGLSGTYLFFNTVVYPAGLFHRYLSPCLLFHLIWKLHSESTSVYMDSLRKYIVIKTVLRGLILCGFCYALSRVFFLSITRLWFPFTSEIDLMGNFISWPYYDLSLKGNEFAHQIYIILYGFFYGALWGSFATLCYGKTHSFRLYMIFPFISQIIWIHLCQTLRVLPEYRIDLWLYMSDYYHSYEVTALLSLVVVLGNAIITTIILKHGGGCNEQNHRHN